jgi:hypothetical protein
MSYNYALPERPLNAPRTLTIDGNMPMITREASHCPKVFFSKAWFKTM